MEQKKCNERHSIRRITIKRELGSPCAKKPKNDNDQDEPESSVDNKIRCTICYKPDVEKKCSTCDRHFHSKCLNWTNMPVDWKCYACLKLKQVPNPSQLDYNLTEMLKIYETMLNFEKRICDFKPFRAEDIVALKQIYIDRVKSRIDQSLFESTDQFINIIHKLVCDIVSVLADKKLISFVKLKAWADSLTKHCNDNMRLLELCSKCFVNKSKDPNNWFTDICESRHRVVWAKVNPYWPAKVLKEEVKWITIIYFDDNEINTISPKNIIDYSDNNPNDAMGEEDIQRLDNTLKDVKRYMEKLGAGVPPKEIANRFSTTLNRYTVSIAASHQLFLRELQSAKNEDLQAHQMEMKKLKEEKEQLARNNGANGETIATLTAEKEQLAAKNAQLVAENFGLEKNNNQLGQNLIKSEVEKYQMNEKLANIQTENDRLLADVAKMKNEVESAEAQRKILQEKINILFE